MNSIFQTFGILAVALVVAIASFQDRIALTLGKTALVAAVAALVVLVLGAGLSLFRRNARLKKGVSPVIVTEADGVEIDEPHSSLT